MNGIRPGALGDFDDFVHPQVTLAGRRGAEQIRLIGVPDMQPIAIHFGVDGDGADPQFAARANDANGDLAPIGNEDFFEHGPSCSQRLGR